MKVLGDRIFLIKDTYPEKIGSIYMPTNSDSKSPPYTGIVKYVGSDVIDVDIKPGVKIAFQDLSGDEITIEGEQLVMIRYANITGVFI